MSVAEWHGVVERNDTGVVATYTGSYTHLDTQQLTALQTVLARADVSTSVQATPDGFSNLTATKVFSVSMLKDLAPLNKRMAHLMVMLAELSDHL
jgi:hypothetical protein